MLKKLLCRRTFLKTSAFAAATLLSARSALANILETDLLDVAQGGGLPEGKLSLYNINLGERLTVVYRNCFGEYCDEALQTLNRLFRCHYNNEMTSMDIRVIEYLHRLDEALGGGNEVHIISGYRSPAYNEKLRSRSRGVAKESLHLKGMAIDLAFPGFSLQTVKEAALSLRAGGVGYYPQPGFVHIDSGRIRSW